jgi:hypothetical protein
LYEIKHEKIGPRAPLILLNDSEIVEIPENSFDEPKTTSKPKSTIGSKKMGIKTELPPLISADKPSNPFAVKANETDIRVETRVNSHIVDALHEISKTKEITAGKTKSVKRKAQTTLFGAMVKEGEVSLEWIARALTDL